MSAIQFPYLRRDVVLAVKALADLEYQRRVWLADEPGELIENLDQEIHTLYDDTSVAQEPFGQIGVILRDAREAEAMRALDRVLSPLYDALPRRIDHAALLAMPEWQGVVAAARAALDVLLDGDVTLESLG